MDKKLEDMLTHVMNRLDSIEDKVNAPRLVVSKERVLPNIVADNPEIPELPMDVPVPQSVIDAVESLKIPMNDHLKAALESVSEKAITANDIADATLDIKNQIDLSYELNGQVTKDFKKWLGTINDFDIDAEIENDNKIALWNTNSRQLYLNLMDKFEGLKSIDFIKEMLVPIITSTSDPKHLLFFQKNLESIIYLMTKLSESFAVRLNTDLESHAVYFDELTTPSTEEEVDEKRIISLAKGMEEAIPVQSNYVGDFIADVVEDEKGVVTSFKAAIV
jgi:hypothetical protein